MRALTSIIQNKFNSRLLRLGFAYIIAALTFITFGTASAADFDGSNPLICATIEALDCVAGQDCTKGRAVDMGAPPFLRIDFSQKTIGGPKRTTTILSMDISDNEILFQGKELDFIWSLAVDRASGNFSAGLVDHDGVFVLFGSCTPL